MTIRRGIIFCILIIFIILIGGRCSRADENQSRHISIDLEMIRQNFSYPPVRVEAINPPKYNLSQADSYDRIIEILNQNNINYYVIEGEASAYSIYNLTFSETWFEPEWTIAVDPSVIPLGSILFVASQIEGQPDFCWGKALDTGSAVIGNQVDLGMETSYRCKEWGRQPVQIVVFPPGSLSQDTIENIKKTKLTP